MTDADKVKGAPDRCLWRRHDEQTQDASEKQQRSANFESLWKQYARPCVHPQSWSHYMAKMLVVVQEISLTLTFVLLYQMALEHQQQFDAVSSGERRQQQQRLAQYQQDARFRLDIASAILSGTLLLVVLMNMLKQSQNADSHRPPLQQKLKQRLTDACLIGTMLRFLANLLCSLTASYADDSVQKLMTACMVLHVLTVDYKYANGEAKSTAAKSQQTRLANQRPPFEGGTLSLNAALFATLLLISRLQNNGSYNRNNGSNNDNITTGYVFCMLAVVIFAFYPLTRHELSVAYPPTQSPVTGLVTFLLSLSTVVLCGQPHYSGNLGTGLLLYPYLSVVAFILIIVPTWKFLLQFHKMSLKGPWDLPATH